MKTARIGKQLALAATLCMAFSAHAQLLGRGGMLGGSNSLGAMGGLRNVTEMTGRGNMQSLSRAPASPAAPAAPAPTLLGGDGNADASGNGDVGLGVSGSKRAAGSIANNAQGTAQVARDGAQAQTDTTRGFAQASTANTRSTAQQVDAAGSVKQATSAASTVQAKPRANASTSANGSGNGNANASQGQ